MEVDFATARMTVTPVGDVPELVGLAGDWITEEATQFLPPHLHLTAQQPRVTVWCERLMAEAQVSAARLTDGGACAGLLILDRMQADGGGTELHLGYILDPSRWGQGLGTELVRGLVDWSHRNGVAALMGGVEDDNPASAAILRKLGFAASDRRADSTMYRLEVVKP